MQLQFQTAFKSITALDEIQLPPLMVLTGANGSGKSHLLEAILQGQIGIREPQLQINEIRLYNPMTLPLNSAQSSLNLTENRAVNAWTYISQARMNGFAQLGIAPVSNLEILTAPQREHMANQINAAVFNFCGRVAMNEVIARAGKQLVDFTEEETYEHFAAFSFSGADPFSRNLTDLFLWYQAQVVKNDFNELRAGKYGTGEIFLTPEQFLTKYGIPPWETLNRMFAVARIPYTVDHPTHTDNRAYQARLKHKDEGTQVELEWLSSGEKILVSLAISLYSLGEWRTGTVAPKLLLLDEIDAFLHPSMIRGLLEAIQSIVIEQCGIPVIFVTHAPTTVALAPEESLYLMKRQAPRLTKVNRDAAIAALTAEVRTVSVRLENRRHVFVESEYDEDLYSDIYARLRDLPEADLSSEISLTFIASGRGGQGNCVAVEHLVNNLSQRGNSSAYGILDWDAQRTSTQRVLVLAENRRYALENIVFDPCLMLYFLVRQQFVAPEEVGLDPSDTHLKIIGLDLPRIQNAVNMLLAKLALGKQNLDMTLEPCTYVGGAQVEIPRWYLRHQGHNLEEHWKVVFPPLNRYRREDELKKDVVGMAFKEWPLFIPIEFVDLFKSIQQDV
jgi:predicted ATPase